LLEDAFVTHDGAALAELFEQEAVLVTGDGRQQARGSEAIARFAGAMWQAHRTYVAAPPRVLQARDTALVVAERSISVVRRASDGGWRYAISLLSLDDIPREEQWNKRLK
jgi:hypothetical protein